MSSRRRPTRVGEPVQAPRRAAPSRTRTGAGLDPRERAARGKAARAQAPRSGHAAFEPAPGRDPVALLEQQSAVRVPELVPIRYGRMLASPFTFYRGAALIMAADLASTPRSGLEVQCCGDAHLSNFGLFASPERRLLFDINDFDETLPGPWEWDVKRLAVSMLVAARSIGLTVKVQERVVLRTVAAYREHMAEYARMRNLDVWYARFELDELVEEIALQVGARMRRRLDRLIGKSVRRDSLHAFARLARERDGDVHIVSQPPLIVSSRDFPDRAQRDLLEASLDGVLRAYRRTLPHERRELLAQFRLVDVATKVVGVGSVGTRAWIGLLLGRDRRDPLFLQVKEAQASVLEPFVGASAYRNAGERVVAGQRVMQAYVDIFLGWLRVAKSLDGGSRDYYVRQLRDWKGSVVVEAMNRRALTVYGRLCAATLARAHARSGDRIAIAAYLGGGDAFDRAVLSFAEAYAEQNDRDYAALRRAVAAGEIVARSDV